MIKTLKTLLFAVMLVSLTLFGACQVVEDTQSNSEPHSEIETEQPSEEHQHVWENYVVTTPAKCLEDGEETATCSCGEKDKRVIPYEGHKFSDWEEIEQPSCKAEGLERRDCNNCDEYETNPIPKTGHNYVDGACSDCGAKEDGYVYTQGQVKAEVNISGKGVADWTIDSANGIYKSVSSANAMLTFKNWQFNGGVIEWDMMVPSDAYAFNTSIGIMFGADVENATTGGEKDTYYVMGRAFTSEFVGYSKNQGAFIWEDIAKLSPPQITSLAGQKYRYRVEWDNVNNIITLTFGDKSVSFNPNNALNGKYFGLYSETAGVEFSNITVTPKAYEKTPGVTVCGGSVWTIGKDANGLTYTCNSAYGTLMFNTLNFTKGTIEWDMIVPSDTGYFFNTVCGVIWGSSTHKVNNHVSPFYCSGRYAGGIFVTYAKFIDGEGNTQFAWENASQIHNYELMPVATSVTYKLEYDGSTFKLSVGGQTVSVTPVHKLEGQYFGLYAELPGTVFSNIKVTNA